MSKSKIMADNFEKIFPLSKTLRFELRPVGRTLEFIQRDGIIDTDVSRAENYKIMKGILDRYYRDFNEEVLSSLKLVGLEAHAALYRNRDDGYEQSQEALRKEVAKAFKSNSKFKFLKKKELIQKELLGLKGLTDEERKVITSFGNFTSYFTGFFENRMNMYSDESKSTAISYRLIDQNLPKFLDNIKVFSLLKKSDIADSIPKLETSLEIIDGFDGISEYFTPDGFNMVLSQKGITVYNTIIGGYAIEDGTKIQGLNELINLNNQKTHEKLPKLVPLYKQVLSDRLSTSFVLDKFEADEEVYDAIEQSYNAISEELSGRGGNISLSDLINGMENCDLNGIYIYNDSSITTISQAMFGDWVKLKDAVAAHYDADHPKGAKESQEKYDEKKEKRLKKIKAFSIGELSTYISEYALDGNICQFFLEKTKQCLTSVSETYVVYSSTDKVKNLKKNDKAIVAMKELLDSFKELQWAIKPLCAGLDEGTKDEFFYAEFSRIWEALDIVTPLYNKVRNYVTEKPYSTEKVKLNFGTPTLLNGWDKNKERDNLGVILLKDDQYFLAIMNSNDRKCFESVPEAVTDDVYRKMIYKLLPGPNKMLPKVLIPTKDRFRFGATQELIDKYERGTHKKGDDFNIEDCHNLIDFFKCAIQKHEDWSKFDFKFSDTDSYNDISEFYREVSDQGYKLTFTNIEVDYINSLVNEGRIYLFQIYNKDFSPYSKGTPNLHTLYWKALFSPENLKDVVYKLNGEAEVFFRKASIKLEETTVHPAGHAIQNKDPLNSKNESLFEYDLIKDRRYTCDKFQFHVPITMNFKSAGSSNVNELVRRELHDAEDVHIIGIDRGERNLLYVSVIDMEGKIVEQFSLNELMSYDSGMNEHKRDYHGMLVEREKENKLSRQNWTTVNSIKELKEGYLSQVIHVIADLMIRYNAVVVMEDLNPGFKRGRQKFDRQVYQKFEKMLIDKLNYLVDKKLPETEDGGLYKAYQLTAKFESFQKLGKQSGFLFYVPAWNTSKIDPTTGFVNLFHTKFESVDKTREFISKFDKIYFDEKTGCYAFEFDYSNFTSKAEGTQTRWTMYTYGERIDHFRNNENNNMWDTKCVDLTAEMSRLLDDYGIEKSKSDLKKAMTSIGMADFHKRFMKIVSLMLQMRNSDEEKGIDQTVSPVADSNGCFFISGEYEGRPVDADANGAYNIAKKGLMLIRKIRQTNIDDLKKLNLYMSNKEWLEFAQENTI